MNLGQRFIGVFTGPKETFSELAEKPVWLEAMVIVFLATFVFGFLIAPFSPAIRPNSWTTVPR